MPPPPPTSLCEETNPLFQSRCDLLSPCRNRSGIFHAQQQNLSTLCRLVVRLIISIHLNLRPSLQCWRLVPDIKHRLLTYCLICKASQQTFFGQNGQKYRDNVYFQGWSHRGTQSACICLCLKILKTALQVRTKSLNMRGSSSSKNHWRQAYNYIQTNIQVKLMQRLGKSLGLTPDGPQS